MLSLLALLQTLALLAISAQAANWNTDVGILATERLDPIISPNGVAQHMHSIIGGSAFAAAYNQPDLMNSRCSTFPVSIDKSNYWHPKPYWINNGGASFTPLPIHDRVYYIREHNSPNEPIQPFPEGLRMIVGNPNSKSANPRSFQYLCRVADKFNGPGDIWSDNWQFDRDCPRGILAQHKFPPCWNGKDLYKSDQSHMAYPQYEAFYGACPASHPIRLPGIMLEVLILTSRWAPGEAVRGKLAWANGDTTGYAIHADFTNGWDTEILRRALTDPVCNTRADITFQECPVFQPFLRTGSCQPERGVLTENFAHNDLVPIARLPGCNPLWTSGAKPGCSPMPSDPDVSPHRAVDGPKVASQPAVPALPTLPGWSQISCVKTADNMLLGQIRSYDNAVSQTTCFDACLRSGYSYASIGRAWGNSWVCDCGTGLNPATPVFPGMCNLTCPSNSSQGCGGSGAHSVFVAPAGTTTIGQYTTSLGCYANPPAGKTGLEQAASYSFSSWNLMTRELCGQACADRGLDWAGIRNDQCFCGSRANFKLGDGNYVNEATCNAKCAGNNAQTCGYWGGLSLFNVTASGYKETTINKAPGYVQCYSDNQRKSLTGAQYYDANLTPQRCQFGCRDLGYSLAAVHGGGMCICGNSLPTVSVLPVSMCSSKCTDASTSFTCGGPGNAELYNTSVVAAEVQAFNARRPNGWQGCFGNSANNVTADFTVNEGRMTVTRCIAACNELGYGWAGLQNRDQCRCSREDPRRNTAQFAANNFCAIPCNGDNSQRCGGWGYVDLYHSPVSTAPGSPGSGENGVPTLPGYQGCFNGSQPLSTYNRWNGAMTVEQCTQGCKEIGQPIAAINSGTCSCGPRWTGGTQLSSLSCGNVCSGNSSQRCGGWPGQSSVYRTEVAADTPKPAGYLGCWQETSPKAVQGYGQWLDVQSVDNCRSICSARGFLLAGLNNGKQCWCGNSLSSASNQIPSQFCANSCPANSGQNCGQWNSVALYRASGNGDMAIPRNANGVISTPSSAAPSSSSTSSSISRSASGSSSSSSRSVSSSSTSTASSTSSSASRASSFTSSSASQSFASSSASRPASSSSASSSASSASSSASPVPSAVTCNSDARTLTGPSYTSSLMTQDNCLFWCREKGMGFAGISGNTCTCGNTRPSSLATTCSTRCSGNNAQLCGGSNVVTVLSTAANAGLTNPYVTTDSAGSLGCWTDSNTRLLPSTSFTNAAMTPSMCVAGCQTRGFKFAGLQHSTQCHCANELNAKANNWKAPESECSARCGGDREQMCGGSWRMNVFEVARAAAVAPSSSASATTSSSTLSSSSSSSSRASLSTTSTTSSSPSASSTSLPATSSTTLTSSRPASSTTSSSTSSSTTTSSTSSSSSTATSPSASGIANEYVGCFIDQNPRSLPGYTFWTNDMTPQKCRDTCRERGFAVSGTTYSRECFCGNDLPTRKVDDKDCSSVCAGDDKLKCGGFWRLSVYAEGDAARASATRAAARRRGRRSRL